MTELGFRRFRRIHLFLPYYQRYKIGDEGSEQSLKFQSFMSGVVCAVLQYVRSNLSSDSLGLFFCLFLNKYKAIREN